MTTLEAMTVFSGRMSRSEFWLKGVLPLSIVLCLAAVPLAYVFGFPQLTKGWGVAMSMAGVWFQLPLWVKRLHDRNRSAWFLLLALVPVIGGFWLFVETGFMRGSFGENRFGADPLCRDVSEQANATPRRSTVCLKTLIPLFLGLILILCFVCTLSALTANISNLKDYFNDALEGKPLPAITCLTMNLVSLLGASAGGAILGFWIWLSLRAYQLSTSRKASIGLCCWLWLSATVGLLLNLILGLSLWLPFVQIEYVRNQNATQKSTLLEEHATPSAHPAMKGRE